MSPMQPPAQSMPPAPLMMHGLGPDKVPAVWPLLAEAEIRALLGRFPQAGALQNVLWHSPRPLSSAVLAQCEGGLLFIKRLPAKVRTVSQLEDEHRFMRYLGERHIPVSDVLLTEDGASATGSEEWTYEVHRNGPGTDRYQDAPSWTPYASDQDAFQAGRTLAQLHLASAGFSSVCRPPMMLSGGGTLLARLVAGDPTDEQLDQRLESWLPADTAVWLAQHAPSWREHIAALLWPLVRQAQRAGLSSALPMIWTHNDWHGSNLLWCAADGGDDSNSGVACVLDFGLCDLGWPMLDLAIAIERAGVDWLAAGFRDAPAPWHASRIRALIRGYHTQQPLGTADLQLLRALLPVAHIEFALSEIEFYGVLMQDSASAQVAYDTYLLGHARWFGTSAGQQLLALLAL